MQTNPAFQHENIPLLLTIVEKFPKSFSLKGTLRNCNGAQGSCNNICQESCNNDYKRSKLAHPHLFPHEGVDLFWWRIVCYIASLGFLVLMLFIIIKKNTIIKRDTKKLSECLGINKGVLRLHVICLLIKGRISTALLGLNHQSNYSDTVNHSSHLALMLNGKQRRYSSVF